MVIAGTFKITRIEEGIPFFARGSKTNETSEDTSYVNWQLSNVTQHSSNVTQETDNVQRETDNGLTQRPLQEAHANAKRAKLAYERTTRIAQEKTQEVAQEVQRIVQEAIMESRKANRAERYNAIMEKLGKVSPCPRLCRGKDCSGTPCQKEEPGFSYSHIKDLVVCPDAALTTMANRDGCYLSHMWPARKRDKKPAPATAPAKNSGGGPRA
jgi:hypothetical protein